MDYKKKTDNFKNKWEMRELTEGEQWVWCTSGENRRREEEEVVVEGEERNESDLGWQAHSAGERGGKRERIGN